MDIVVIGIWQELLQLGGVGRFGTGCSEASDATELAGELR
jgi:hypothetical protein